MTLKLTIPNTKNLEIWFSFINENFNSISINNQPTNIIVDYIEKYSVLNFC